MSESTKLKNLLNKVKPTIQYEVRKKKPKSTSEFLEFAKEAEELVQLSATTIHSNTATYTVPYVNFPTTSSSSGNASLNFSRNFNQNRSLQATKKVSFNPASSTFTYNSSQSPRYASAASYSSTRNFQPNQYKAPATASNNNSNNSTSKSNSNNRQSIQRSQVKNLRNTMRSHSRSANVICSADPLGRNDNTDQSFLDNICTICQQSDHEASACKSF
ncbi:unnamed protein product [Rotaria magnacalcarata]|uniref:Uncharacterized protein n=1 Tax=Rotaria magnacalcarata TaxID=392030 RepID=A0A816RF98_9BILA|nr:unnamed protein product [Rotaria magnacalcarata]CAF4298277.1 unnamed protein product [Rotaria magnacalcarata]